MNKQLISSVISSNLSAEDKVELIRVIVADDEYISVDEAHRELVAVGLRDDDVEPDGALVHASHAVHKYGWPYRGDLFDPSLKLRLNDWSHVLRDNRHQVASA